MAVILNVQGGTRNNRAVLILAIRHTDINTRWGNNIRLSMMIGSKPVTSRRQTNYFGNESVLRFLEYA
jgi:hypothetical protein